jgi:zinc/manganese transport system permease protein
MQDLLLFWPALVAGLLVTATHVPLGIQVLKRGIVFIDLAVAQIAGLGVIAADWLGFGHHGLAAQVSALAAALAAALALNWTDRRWPEVQEAIIGVAFILAANAAILLLAAHPQGSEHLKDMLVGQLLWVKVSDLPIAAIVSAAVLVAWFSLRGRFFYLIFACAVTLSVQLVGIYLVFATLIIPALATRGFIRGRLAASYVLGALGYAAGLALSALSDLPAGPTIVCMLALVGAIVFLAQDLARRAPRTSTGTRDMTE